MLCSRDQITPEAAGESIGGPEPSLTRPHARTYDPSEAPADRAGRRRPDGFREEDMRIVNAKTTVLRRFCFSCSSWPRPLAPRPLAGASLAVKPYRVLLVIGDQWKDPDEHADRRRGRISGSGDPAQILGRAVRHRPPGPGALEPVALPGRRPAGPATAPSSGTPTSPEPILKQDYGVLARAVRDHRIGLIALADRIKEPVIQGLLGVRFRAVHPHSSDLRIVQDRTS